MRKSWFFARIRNGHFAEVMGIGLFVCVLHVSVLLCMVCPYSVMVCIGMHLYIIEGIACTDRYLSVFIVSVCILSILMYL